MNIDTLRIIAVVLGALAFLGVCWWAFSPKRKKRFEEDARLPFADEEPAQGADRDSDKASKNESGSAGQEGGSSARQNGPSAGSDSAGAEKKGQDKQ